MGYFAKDAIPVNGRLRYCFSLGSTIRHLLCDVS
jgi:hypothetical protein